MCLICESFGKLSLQGIQGSGTLSGGASTATPKIFTPAELASRIATVNWGTHDVADRWHTSSAPKLQMTYSFESAQPSDLWGSFSGWTAFSAVQKASVQKALALFSEVINVNFTEVATSHADPDINFGRVNLPYAGLGGFSYGISGSTKSWDGFAVFDKALGLTSQDDFSIILHEIGHALGLKHTGNYDVSGGGAGGPVLSTAEDSNLLSVMSYVDNPINGRVSDNLMLLDIAALQVRFGANLTHRTGNDVYTGPRGGRIDVVWDAGGSDTISGAARSVAQIIDLREGGFSSLGANANFAVAYGTKIENGIGGGGADTLTGNALANILRGGSGNDKLAGGAGNDLIFGDAGNDTLSGQAGADRLTGGSGLDSFVFAETPGAANADRILDFSSVADTIRLAKSVFSALDLGVIDASEFRTIVTTGAAIDGSDRIIYNRATGDLVYDRDGSGAAAGQVFAKLSAGLTLSAADFLVF